MLRGVVLALGAVCFGFGVWGLATGFAGGFVFTIFGVLLLAGTLYERVRYKANAKGAPGPGWEKTSERFVDDETGKPVTVYIKPETGERTYVED
jgi:hypothetical protein